MRRKKIPHSIYAKVEYNGVHYSIKLHGRSRKRVIVSYWYVDATGGYEPNLDKNVIYDNTFENDTESRKVANDFYKNPHEIEDIFLKYYSKDHLKYTVDSVNEYMSNKEDTTHGN